MADTSPYSDDLDGTRAGRPEGDDTGNTPEQHPDHDSPDTSGVDAEPNDVGSMTTPPAGDAGMPASGMYESGMDADDMADDEDDDQNSDEAGAGAMDFDDTEPNDTDSQFLPPEGADEDFDDFDDDEDLVSDDALVSLDEPNDTDSQVSSEQIGGIISFVGVPIGHRDDITFRAHHTLQMADVVVCEDFKVAARLLRNYNISKKLVEMNERNEESASEEVLALLRRGKTVAVIANAGLPMLADAGGLLATKLRKIGMEPKIVPGVSSVMVGLMASGFGMENFDFVGVLSRRPEDRRRALEELALRDRTIVMLEAPFRLRSLLTALVEVMPDRRAALTVNLTTPFETVIRGTIAELSSRFAQKRFKGDLVLVLDRLQATDLGRSMSRMEFDPDQEVAEEAGMEEDFVGDVDAGAKPFRRTPRTAPPTRDTGDTERPRRDTNRFGSRPPRGGEQRGGWNREGGERRSGGAGGGGDDRRSTGGGERRSGGPSGGGGWNREGGERRSGGAGGGGGWNREGGERRNAGGGGWNREGGERRSGGAGGGGWGRDGGERRSGGAGGGGGWNREGGERRSGGGGGWNREGGERRGAGGGGGWGGERRSGGAGGGGERRSGGGGGWGREGGERRSSGGGGGWGRDGGERRGGGGGGWNREGGERRSGGGGAGKGRGGPGGSRGFGPRGGGR